MLDILASSYTQLPLSADWSKVERIGAPSYHFVDVERYRFSEPNLKNPNFYPIPTAKVTRDSYMNVLDQMDLANLVTNTNRGERGPFLYLPVLAKYVQTQDPYLGQSHYRHAEKLSPLPTKNSGRKKMVLGLRMATSCYGSISSLFN